MRFSDRIRLHLAELPILPRRLTLRLAEPLPVSISRLRGVWGAALHETAPNAYGEVFEGTGPADARTPGYLLRFAGVPGDTEIRLEWISFGPALHRGDELQQAWRFAGTMGLGRERIPFHVREIVPVGPTGDPAAVADWPQGWPVSMDRRPFIGADGHLPARLALVTPTRILRRLPGAYDATLLEQPRFGDIALGALRRLSLCLRASPTSGGALASNELDGLHAEVLDHARATPSGSWHGQRADLMRYSASQREDLELRGVTGYLDLPGGLGELWPLLVAAQWFHLGKGTSMGMGQVAILPLPDVTIPDPQ